MITIKDIVTKVAKKEAKKSQASVGNIREIIGHLSDMVYNDSEIITALINNGKRRYARRNK